MIDKVLIERGRSLQDLKNSDGGRLLLAEMGERLETAKGYILSGGGRNEFERGQLQGSHAELEGLLAWIGDEISDGAKEALEMANEKPELEAATRNGP